MPSLIRLLSACPCSCNLEFQGQLRPNAACCLSYASIHKTSDLTAFHILASISTMAPISIYVGASWSKSLPCTNYPQFTENCRITHVTVASTVLILVVLRSTLTIQVEPHTCGVRVKLVVHPSHSCTQFNVKPRTHQSTVK